jgi:hypothetical protein
VKTKCSLADVLHQVGREKLAYVGDEPLVTLEPGEPYASISSSGPPESVMEIAEAGGSLKPGFYLLPHIPLDSLVALTSSQVVDAGSPVKGPLDPGTRLIRPVRRRP